MPSTDDGGVQLGEVRVHGLAERPEVLPAERAGQAALRRAATGSGVIPDDHGQLACNQHEEGSPFPKCPRLPTKHKLFHPLLRLVPELDCRLCGCRPDLPHVPARNGGAYRLRDSSQLLPESQYRCLETSCGEMLAEWAGIVPFLYGHPGGRELRGGSAPGASDGRDHCPHFGRRRALGLYRWSRTVDIHPLEASGSIQGKL
mmetsp:Transcript_35747/g.83374  ORF Transcript_35747/g.83374 Transcript_35747/m.83374 type:complete len:202 (-) Transcript_35747:229-834(-)